MLLTNYDVLHPIWACALVGAVAYVVALADKYLKLHILSLLARQVVFVLIPPLGPDLPRARHDLPRHRDADRRRRHGRDRRADPGVRQPAARLVSCSSRRWTRRRSCPPS